MTVKLVSNFFSNARGITFKDGGGITWTFNQTTNEMTATGAGGAGIGTVTSVSVVTASGVSGSVANPTTTPAITLTLGAITPTSVAASGALACFGAALPAQVTGFGTPVGAAVVASYNSGTSTSLQDKQTIAQILAVLKAAGIIGN